MLYLRHGHMYARLGKPALRVGCVCLAHGLRLSGMPSIPTTIRSLLMSNVTLVHIREHGCPIQMDTLASRSRRSYGAPGRARELQESYGAPGWDRELQGSYWALGKLGSSSRIPRRLDTKTRRTEIPRNRGRDAKRRQDIISIYTFILDRFLFSSSINQFIIIWATILATTLATIYLPTPLSILQFLGPIYKD